MTARLRWRGPQVAAQVRRAEAAAVDETTEAAAGRARSVRSGRIARLTTEPAVARGGRVVGRWGLFPEPRGGDVFFELFHEIGTAYLSGDHAKRRAADAEYPQLASRIRRRLG